MSTFANINVNSVVVSENYVRKVISDEQIFAIAEALEGGACLPPISVYRRGKQFICFDGAKRLQAAVVAGLETIAAVVYAEAGRWSAAEVMAAVQANIGRENLQPLEVAEAAIRLGTEADCSIAVIAKAFGYNEGTLNNYCLLYKKANAVVREKILTGSISYSAALEAIGLGAEEFNTVILAAIAEGKTTQKAMRERAKAAKGEVSSPKAKPGNEASAPSEKSLDTELEAALKLILGASTVVDCGKGVVQAHGVDRVRVLELAKMLAKPSVAAATASAMA